MAEKKPRVTVVSLIGRPFAGKDSLAEQFQANYSRVGIAATGVLLRDKDFLSRAGFSQKEIDDIHKTMRAGVLVPDAIPERLMHEAIIENVKEGKSLIFLTGHPRTIHQEEDLKTWIKEQNAHLGVQVDQAFLHLFLQPEIANSRRLSRLASQGREDDKSEEQANDRHKEFEKNAWPMLMGMWRRKFNMFRREKEKIALVFADKPKETVYRNVERKLRRYLPPKKA